MTQINNNLKDLIRRGDATSSWSGFTYQGNITIYSALCLLNKIGNNVEEIKKYEIEIEKNEDFAILYEGELKSLHQVKSLQNKEKISGYTEAILQLFAKAIEFPSVIEISLHTACEIESFIKEDLISNLKNYNPSSLSENKRQLYRSTQEKLLDQQIFDEKFIIFKRNYDISGYIPAIKSIPLEDVKENIEQELEKFYTNHHENYTYKTSEQYSFAYLNLLKRLNKKISRIHDGSDTNYCLRLIDVYDVIYDEHVFGCTAETLGNFLLKELYSLFEQYCEDSTLGNDRLETVRNIWSKQWELLEKLPDDDFILLCRRLSPEIKNISTKSLDLNTYRKLLNEAGVRRMLFYCLFDLTHKMVHGETIKNIFTVKDNDDYLLTLIDRNNPDMVGRDIIKNLKDDKSLFDLLFDNKFYLTEHLDGVYGGKRSEGLMESEVKITGNRKKEKITLPKQIHFVSKTTISGRTIND
ncbi:hypothetical protein SAMN05421663_10574 [Terribacillus halophilus]|uniref:ABC-three component systems C-terminal domain-containing protein n=1 Tax=Terribacillus halophilus TaxID=361279 RepID=A0A1G6QGU0_9BACI|nr:ABC-three component system protein [Terribacillus halophilus]SDC91538.1 hypothetical protein SAMN05421663_10574 [Terribacillus halophilus]